MGNYIYGKAAFIILMMALVCGVVHFARSVQRQAVKPDLVMAIFAANHEEAYRQVIGDFEKQHGVKIQLQLVAAKALQSRLQSALLTGAEVPDLVELLEGSMGYFTRGPLQDVGFVDLTDRLHEEGLYQRMVESRYSLWSSRGRIFAMPHDVHPVALCYRRDLVEQLGIKVENLKTWDDFVAMGRSIMKDLDGDGNPDRYALDTPLSTDVVIRILLQQRGGQYFDPDGRVVFDSRLAAGTIAWYVRQTAGPARIGYDAGWGQSLVKAMNDGLVLFFFCPDWRTKQFEMDTPNLAGKLGLIPLPAWDQGGRRTSTWGGTGLAITRACKKQELAWKFVKFLYLNEQDLGKRFKSMSVLPPLEDAWKMPEFDEPRAFYGGQAIGRLFADLAPETPPLYVSPYGSLASAKITEVYLDAVDFYIRSGDQGLEEYIMDELKKKAQIVRKMVDRNVFFSPGRQEAK
jgi:arabinosaccharide transport system substrate-binding protein